MLTRRYYIRNSEKLLEIRNLGKGGSIDFHRMAGVFGGMLCRGVYRPLVSVL